MSLPKGVLDWAKASGYFDRPETREWRRLLGKDLLPECLPVADPTSAERWPDSLTAAAYRVLLRLDSPEMDSAGSNAPPAGCLTETVRLFRVDDSPFFVGQHTVTRVMFFLRI
ncbi:MAG: hypothetical protein SFU56_08805 [Capsulimonadales bacterium]|nr:hypothetical protein [Capsulimonadales bacterium]